MKTVLIGLGAIGLQYDLEGSASGLTLKPETCLTHARAISEDSGFTLDVGVDVNEKARRLLENVYGVSAVPTVGDLAGDEFDLVVIATPMESHDKVLHEVFEAFNPSLVVCEKPVGSRGKEARAIQLLGQAYEVPICVNYFRQYLPSTRRITNFLGESSRGDFLGGTVVYSLGLRRNASHFVRLLPEWIGSPLQDARVLRRSSTNTDSPSFGLGFDASTIEFFGVNSPNLRLAEMTLVFDAGLLRVERGGIGVSWVAREEGSGRQPLGARSVTFPTEYSKYQRYIYRSISSRSVAGVQMDEDLAVCVMVQDLIDEVLDER